jgi:hypothetical protein
MNLKSFLMSFLHYLKAVNPIFTLFILVKITIFWLFRLNNHRLSFKCNRSGKYPFRYGYAKLLKDFENMVLTVKGHVHFALDPLIQKIRLKILWLYEDKTRIKWGFVQF